MKNCARCGRENPDSATFCADCGSAFTMDEHGAGAVPPTQPPPAGMGPQPGGASPPLHPYPTTGQQAGEATPPYYQLTPGAHPPQGPPPGAPYAVMAQASNGKATASLILGIIGLFICPIVCSILAIILGSIAKSEIAASGGWQTGESNAKAGVILGWIGLAIYLVSLTVWAMIVVAAAAGAAMPPPLP